MDDAVRQGEIARLWRAVDGAQARRGALLEEINHLVAHLPETRRRFGNPFFYSHPDEPDEGIAHYTGNRSHDIGFPTMRAWRRVERELIRLKNELRQLGVDVPE
jgi:hypothetical protein